VREVYREARRIQALMEFVIVYLHDHPETRHLSADKQQDTEQTSSLRTDYNEEGL
jgi:hypothetical protein